MDTLPALGAVPMMSTMPVVDAVPVWRNSLKQRIIESIFQYNHMKSCERHASHHDETLSSVFRDYSYYASPAPYQSYGLYSSPSPSSPFDSELCIDSLSDHEPSFSSKATFLTSRSPAPVQECLTSLEARIRELSALAEEKSSEYHAHHNWLCASPGVWTKRVALTLGLSFLTFSTVRYWGNMLLPVLQSYILKTPAHSDAVILTPSSATTPSPPSTQTSTSPISTFSTSPPSTPLVIITPSATTRTTDPTNRLRTSEVSP